MFEEKPVARPRDVLRSIEVVKLEASARAEGLREDKKLSAEFKTQEIARLKEATNGKIRDLRKKYADAVETRRLDLERGLMGGLRSTSTSAEQRALLKQADEYAEDPAAFAKAVKRAETAGDRPMLDALTYAARGSAALRTLIPADLAERYAALDDFEQDDGAAQSATQRFGAKIAMSEWVAPKV